MGNLDEASCSCHSYCFCTVLVKVAFCFKCIYPHSAIPSKPVLSLPVCALWLLGRADVVYCEYGGVVRWPEMPIIMVALLHCAHFPLASCVTLLVRMPLLPHTRYFFHVLATALTSMKQKLFYLLHFTFLLVNTSTADSRATQCRCLAIDRS